MEREGGGRLFEAGCLLTFYAFRMATSSPGLFPLKMGGAAKGPGIGWSRVPSYTLKSWV